MADLSLSRALRELFPSLTKAIKVPLNGGAAMTIYKGQPVMFDNNVDTGSAIGFTSSVTPASDDVFLGIAMEKVEVEASDADDEKKVTVGLGIIGLKNDFSFTVADLKKSVYFSDSGTLTTTAGTNLGPVGTIFWIEDGWVFVEFAQNIQS